MISQYLNHVLKKNGILVFVVIVVFVLLKMCIINSSVSNYTDDIFDSLIRETYDLTLKEKENYINDKQEYVINNFDKDSIEYHNYEQAITLYIQYLNNANNVKGYIDFALTGEGLRLPTLPNDFYANINGFKSLDTPNVIHQAQYQCFLQLQHFFYIPIVMLVLIAILISANSEYGIYKIVNISFKRKKYYVMENTVLLLFSIVLVITNFLLDFLCSGLDKISFTFDSSVQSINMLSETTVNCSIGQFLWLVLAVDLVISINSVLIFTIIAHYSREIKKYFLLSFCVIIFVSCIKSIAPKTESVCLFGITDIYKVFVNSGWSNILNTNSLFFYFALNIFIALILFFCKTRQEKCMYV